MKPPKPCKVLYVATSDTHLATFHRPYLRWLREYGCDVDLAVEIRGGQTFEGVSRIHPLPFPRTISFVRLYKTYRWLKKIINDGNYQLIHCHTPIPSMLVRMASISARKKGTQVLYTAHGFHFFKGSKWINWVIYFPVEYLLSIVTDGIVTINKEDYELAVHSFKCPRVFYVNGVGVDAQRFKPCDATVKSNLRAMYGFSADDFILTYVAEHIHRKNHPFILEALPELKSRIPRLNVLFVGTGALTEPLKERSRQLGLQDVVHFLGFREDVNRLACISDVGISSSRQEGLGLGLVELMMSGVPVVATLDRGHKEFIEDGLNGHMFEQNDTRAFCAHVHSLFQDPERREKMGLQAWESAQKFELKKAVDAMASVYNFYLPDH